MTSDRIRRLVRGMSVAASSSVLVLAAVGAASAHPLSLRSSTEVDAGREALIALIGRYEPFEDAASIEALADQVLLAWPDAASIAIDMLDDTDDEDDAHEDASELDEDESDDADEDEDADDDSDEDSDVSEDDDEDSDEDEDDESEDDEDEDEEDSDESEDDDSDEDEDED